MPTPASDRDLYADLRALVASTFPKRCRNCGHEYATAADFVAATEPVGDGRSGLKQTVDDDGATIVELFRNCQCGSTLMDTFDNRRGNSPAASLQRQRVEELIRHLVARGIESARARAEVLAALHGQPNELLAQIKDS
jgi:hypothetical protein